MLTQILCQWTMKLCKLRMWKPLRFKSKLKTWSWANSRAWIPMVKELTPLISTTTVRSTSTHQSLRSRKPTPMLQASWILSCRDKMTPQQWSQRWWLWERWASPRVRVMSHKLPCRSNRVCSIHRQPSSRVSQLFREHRLQSHQVQQVPMHGTARHPVWKLWNRKGTTITYFFF